MSSLSSSEKTFRSLLHHRQQTVRLIPATKTRVLWVYTSFVPSRPFFPTSPWSQLVWMINCPLLLISRSCWVSALNFMSVLRWCLSDWPMLVCSHVQHAPVTQTGSQPVYPVHILLLVMFLTQTGESRYMSSYTMCASISALLLYYLVVCLPFYLVLIVALSPSLPWENSREREGGPLYV